jgi:hypothetical protein
MVVLSEFLQTHNGVFLAEHRDKWNGEYQTRLEYRILTIQYLMRAGEVRSYPKELTLDDVNRIEIQGRIADHPLFVATGTGQKYALFKIEYTTKKTKKQKADQIHVLDVLTDHPFHIALLKRHAEPGTSIKCTGSLVTTQGQGVAVRDIFSYGHLKGSAALVLDVQDFFDGTGRWHVSLHNGEINRISKTLDRERVKQTLPLDIRNDIAEYYDRAANMTDYTKSYGQKLVRHDRVDHRSAAEIFEDYYFTARQAGFYDVVAEMAEMYIAHQADHHCAVENFVDDSCYITVNQLAALGMKSFRGDNRALRYLKIDLTRHFTARPVDELREQRRYDSRKRYNIMPVGYDFYLKEEIKNQGGALNGLTL